MRGHTLAPGLGLLYAHRDLLGRELAHLAGHAGDRFARQVDLQRVHAVLGEHAHASAHLLGAADDGAEGELRLRQVRRGRVAQPAGDGDLLAGGQVARADDGAVVDGIADDDVQPRLGRGGPDAGGPTHVEIDLGDFGAPQDVLFGRHALDGLQPRLVVPGKMRVRLDHARHQEGAGTVDGLCAQHGRRALAVAGLDHATDAVALHQHVAGEGRFATAVEDAHVGEEDVAHGRPFSAGQPGTRAARARIPPAARSVSSGRSAAAPPHAPRWRRGSVRPASARPAVGRRRLRRR